MSSPTETSPRAPASFPRAYHDPPRARIPDGSNSDTRWSPAQRRGSGVGLEELDACADGCVVVGRWCREIWAYAPDETLSNEQLIGEAYAGIRPAPGYPACPDHTEKELIWDLLAAEENAGMKLTESYAMWPGSSVSGFYFSHRESQYFGVGKIGRDQVEDYARRKEMTVAEVERWLSVNLDYLPGS